MKEGADPAAGGKRGGAAREFLLSALGDALLPTLRGMLEDVVVETIDRKQIPSRTDFKELRDLANALRGQLTGATGGIKRLVDQIDDLREDVARQGQELGELKEALRLEREQRLALERELGQLHLREEPSLEAVPPAEEAGAEPRSTICSEPGCGEPVRARGLCGRHYQRHRRSRSA
jgi:hypothetical protein